MAVYYLEPKVGYNPLVRIWLEGRDPSEAFYNEGRTFFPAGRNLDLLGHTSRRHSERTRVVQVNTKVIKRCSRSRGSAIVAVEQHFSGWWSASSTASTSRKGAQKINVKTTF